MSAETSAWFKLKALATAKAVKGHDTYLSLKSWAKKYNITSKEDQAEVKQRLGKLLATGMLKSELQLRPDPNLQHDMRQDEIVVTINAPHRSVSAVLLLSRTEWARALTLFSVYRTYDTQVHIAASEALCDAVLTEVEQSLRADRAPGQLCPVVIASLVRGAVLCTTERPAAHLEAWARGAHDSRATQTATNGCSTSCTYPAAPPTAKWTSPA